MAGIPRLQQALVTLVSFVSLVSVSLVCFLSMNNKASSSLVISPWPFEVKTTGSGSLVNSTSPRPVETFNVTPSHSQGRKLKSGFVLAMDYSDQLTAGSVNLLSLQCWASQLHDRVKVVEPFLRCGSYWGVEASHLRNASTLRLRDIFNATGWRRYSTNRALSPLANWEDFLKTAPRKMVLAGLGRKALDKRFYDFALKFAKVRGFKIVRQVCTDSKIVFSAREFQSRIYGNFRPADTVVLFDTWSGISGTLPRPPLRYRLPINDLHWCERDSSIKKFMDSIPQSRRILGNGRRYIKRFLSHSSHGYIAVMFRLEQLFVGRKLITESDKLRGGSKCIESILKKVTAIKRKGLTQVFLAMDSGKYGSYKYRSKNRTVVHQLSHDLFRRLYDGGSMTFDSWEASFRSVADFLAPGYVAMLQLSVAVRATELLLAGGGSFQSVAEREIKFRHQSNARVHHIRDC